MEEEKKLEFPPDSELREEEFNLSKKIHFVRYWDDGVDMIIADDVREFIRRLKEWFPEGAEMIRADMFLDFLDKLAGNKLTEGSDKGDSAK